MTSAIAERPYMRLRCVTGTLPGRNPLIRTRSFNSSRRALTLASSSEAGTTTLYSRLRPSDSVSVTCIGLTFFSACTYNHIALAYEPNAQVVSEYGRTRKTLIALPSWCGRRDSNPHDFRHWNLNPARLPIPPRPRRANYGRFWRRNPGRLNAPVSANQAITGPADRPWLRHETGGAPGQPRARSANSRR